MATATTARLASIFIDLKLEKTRMIIEAILVEDVS